MWLILVFTGAHWPSALELLRSGPNRCELQNWRLSVRTLAPSESASSGLLAACNTLAIRPVSSAAALQLNQATEKSQRIYLQQSQQSAALASRPT